MHQWCALTDYVIAQTVTAHASYCGHELLILGLFATQAMTVILGEWRSEMLLVAVCCHLAFISRTGRLAIEPTSGDAWYAL